MRWSWKLGTLLGVGIYVHWTFLLLVGWYLFMQLNQGASLPQAAVGIGFLLSVFACVVLHELGHATAARRFGIKTRDITLLPIGGLARLERMPEDPKQELWVAVAGPLVNVVIAALLLPVILLLPGLASEGGIPLLGGGSFLFNLAGVNVFLVIFNLIPAFPMDGGRVLRAVLAWVSGDYVRATQAAATVGQGVAIVFGLLGLMGGYPMLIFIALFVFVGAQEEARMVQMRSAFRGVPVRQAMMTQFRALQPGDSLEVAVQELLAGAQQDFPVVEGGQVVGVLLRADLMKALAEGRRDALVGDVVHRDGTVAEETEMLDGALERMRDNECSSVPVMRGGQIVGMITLENVGELAMIHSALGQGRRARPA